MLDEKKLQQNKKNSNGDKTKKKNINCDKLRKSNFDNTKFLTKLLKKYFGKNTLTTDKMNSGSIFQP